MKNSKTGKTGKTGEPDKISRVNRKEAFDFYHAKETQKVNAAFALVVAIPILIAIGYALQFIPNKIDEALISSTYNLPLKDFIPEKPETCQYVILSVLFPILFCAFYKLFSARKGGTGYMASEWSTVIYPTGLASITVISIWSILGNYNGVQGFSTLINTLFTILVIVVIVLWAVLLAGLSICHESSRSLREIVRIPVLLIGIMATLAVSWLYVTDHYFINSYTLHHFDAYYYPVFEVFSGKTLLLDFNSLYGFYPYLMAPVFKLIGGISMFRFSILMAILVLVNISAIGLAIWINVKNRIIALGGFTAILFTSCVSSLIINSGYYLQYFPHRTLFPSLLVLACSLWIKTKRPGYKRALTIAGYVLCTLSLLWNIDSGVVVAAGWCLFLIYDVVSSHTLKEKRFYTESLKIIGFTVLSVFATLGAVLLLTYFRTGLLVDLKNMIASQILFKGTGYYMLPMPLQHPWIILAIVYMAGLVKSLSGLPLLRKNERSGSDHSHAMMFFLAILGVGLFSYYQGRSHKDVFPAVIWPGILLVVLFADEYADRIAIHRVIYQKMNSIKKPMAFTDLSKLFLTIGLLLTLSLSLLVTDFKDDINIFNIKSTVSKNSQKTNLDNRLNFIRRHSTNPEEVDILTTYFAEYYTMLNVKNPMPLRSIVDWFTKEDYQKVIDYLKTSHHPLFIDKKVYNMMMTYMPKEFTGVINQRFTLVDAYDTITYYELIQQ